MDEKKTRYKYAEMMGRLLRKMKDWGVDEPTIDKVAEEIGKMFRELADEELEG